MSCRGTPGLLALALMAPAGWAQSLDPNGFFRLSSQAVPGMSLSVELTGDYPPGDTRIVMLPTDPADIRQIWAIEQYGSRLVFTSALAGRGWALALDANNFFLKLEPRNQTAADQNWSSAPFFSGFQIGNAAVAGKALESSNELPRMDPAGSFTGQIWTFTRALDIPDPPTVANATLRIRNRFRGTYLFEDNGAVSTGALAEGDTRGHWEVSKRAGTGYYDAKTYVLVNKATGHWLNMETGTLAASVAQPNWVSARWWLEPRETEAGQPPLTWWRIANAYEVRNTITLNTETSLLATSLLGRTGWHSAEWAFDLAPCTFTVTGAPTGALAAGGQSGSFTITPNSSVCAWTAASSQSWLTVTPASGTGTATVNWTAAANSTGATRTATITAAGQTFNVSQASTACTFTVTGVPTSAAAGGQSGTFTITPSGSACAWTAASSQSWLTVTPASGSGTATVNWTAASNVTSAARTATITAGGQTFNVSQATACVATFSSSGISISSAATTGSVGFTLPSGCANTPTSSDAWLTASITATGTLAYSATINASVTARTATITLAGAAFTVVQSGLVCSYALSPASAGSTAAAGGGSVAVTAQTGCAWTAVASSGSPWLRVEGTASGTGSGGFAYAVDANPTSSPRTGTITVQGQTFTLTQQGGACVIVFGSSSVSVGAAASSGTMTFSHPTGCSGTPVSSAPWLTVSFGAPFTLNYSVAANPSSIGRSATITLAGSTFTVSQSGAACSYTLTPGSRTVPSAQNTGTVSISAPAGCVWAATADTGAPWLRIQGAPSGVGTSELTYTVDANSATTARTGVITVQSRTFTVNQNGSAQTMACAATSTPVTLRRNGMTELTADVLLNCTGVPSAGVMADLTLTLSRTVTSRVLDAAGVATEALLVLNEATSPVLGTSAWQAGLAGPNALRWKAVRIAPSGSGQASLRLTNLRVNTVPDLGNVTGLVEMRSSASIALAAPSVTVGTVAEAVTVLRSGTSAGPAANQNLLPVVFRELVGNAFRTRSGAAGTIDRNTESGYFLTSGALTAGQADTATRLHLKLSLPAGVRLLAPLTPDGSTSARLVSADANGGGGSDVAATTPGYADITGAGGTVSATWEVRASSAAAVESFTFPLIIQGATPAQLETIGAGLTAGLAPFSTTPGAVLGAAIPRFAEAGRPVKLVNLRVVPTLVSTGVRPLAGKSGARLAVSGNLAFNYDVFNDSSEASGTTVVRSSAPPGYSFSPGGTQAPDAAKIEFSGDGSEATLTYTGVAAGASTSLRMEVIPLMDPAPGELVENVVTVESRDLDIDLTNNRASAGVVSASCSVSAGGANFVVAGGTGEFQISACAAWSVASSDSWVTVTSARTGTGAATVRYTVAPNPGTTARVTTIIAGGATFTVTQSGTGSCALTASAPDLASPPAEGRRANITVTLAGGACAWTARSTAPWAEVFTTSGTTSTVISVTVYPNFGTQARSATVTVGDQAIAVTQPGMTGGDNVRFVRRTYFNVLRRLPSATEEAFHAGSLNIISRSQMMQNFLTGGEFRAGGAFVTGLYRVLLGRVPERGGWAFQLNAVVALNIAQPSLTGNFLGAPEWLLKQGGTITDEAFVRLLFTEVLGRQPSAAELAFQLPNAANRSQMATNFLGIEEFYSRNGALLNAIHAYFVILGRDPTTEERAGLEAQLRGGKTFTDLVTEFVNSAEHNVQLQ